MSERSGLASPTALAARRLGNRLSPRPLSPSGSDSSSVRSRRSASLITSAEDAELFEQMSAATSVRLKKKNRVQATTPISSPVDDLLKGDAATVPRSHSLNTAPAVSEEYADDEGSSSQKRQDLDLNNNDNSFHVLANLLVDFFQAKVDSQSNCMVLRFPDRAQLERILPQSARANFIHAVNYRLARTPSQATSPLQFLTLQCQELGLEKEGSENPIRALLAMSSGSPSVSIPVFSILDNISNYSGKSSDSAFRKMPATQEAEDPIQQARTDPDGDGDDDMMDPDDAGQYDMELEQNNDVHVVEDTPDYAEDIDEYEEEEEDDGDVKIRPEKEPKGEGAKDTVEEKYADFENEGGVTEPLDSTSYVALENRDPVAEPDEVHDTPIAVVPEVIPPLVSEIEEKDPLATPATQNVMDFSEAPHAKQSDLTDAYFTAAAGTAFENPALYAPVDESNFIASPPDVAEQPISSEIHLVKETVETKDPATRDFVNVSPLTTTMDGIPVSASAELVRQQLQAELREATNLMEESINPETAKFWSDHVADLQTRLRALEGDAPAPPVSRANTQTPDIILEKNLALLSDLQHADSYVPPSPLQQTEHAEQIDVMKQPFDDHANTVKELHEDEYDYEAPMVDVVAPADLPGGYHFEAEIEGQRFLATVPPGGVKQGETFTSYMRELDSVAIDIPVGYWKDNLTDICRYGCCHPVVWNSCFFPLITLSQIQARVSLDFLGRPSTREGRLSNRTMMVIVTCFWVVVNVALFGGYNLKWSRKLELSIADVAALGIINLAMLGFVVFVTQSTRNSLREKFLIRESRRCNDLEDLWCASLCLPCTVCQMARHTANYDDYEAVCCSKSGLPDGVRVNQTPVKESDIYVV